ncbi:regulatory particle non-ATPase [Agyrium rufum]|nr:regulatory particle non-ATPase [Agyrium rufum]
MGFSTIFITPVTRARRALEAAFTSGGASGKRFREDRNRTPEKSEAKQRRQDRDRSLISSTSASTPTDGEAQKKLHSESSNQRPSSPYTTQLHCTILNPVTTERAKSGPIARSIFSTPERGNSKQEEGKFGSGDEAAKQSGTKAQEEGKDTYREAEVSGTKNEQVTVVKDAVVEGEKPLENLSIPATAADIIQEAHIKTITPSNANALAQPEQAFVPATQDLPSPPPPKQEERSHRTSAFSLTTLERLRSQESSSQQLTSPPPPTLSQVSNTPTAKMTSSEHTLHQMLHTLNSHPPSSPSLPPLLSRAKIALLHANALLPTSSTPPSLLPLARSILEKGALTSIAHSNPDAFTRYYQQLQPFYELPASAYPMGQGEGERSKITGLFLLMLLTKGDYAGFHTLLEGLEGEDDGGKSGGGKGKIEDDRYLAYPVMLERWLMEGAYDRVWKALDRGVPGEEFGVFTEVLTTTIRLEIASCSEKAYPSLPIANAKNLLFLDSEGAVVDFSKQRGWIVRDGRIYFPVQPTSSSSGVEGGIDGENGRGGSTMAMGGSIIENTIGYARELETIV